MMQNDEAERKGVVMTLKNGLMWKSWREVSSALTLLVTTFHAFTGC